MTETVKEEFGARLPTYLGNVLDIIVGLSGRTVTTSVLDAAVVRISNLPEEEVHGYLSQLQGLGLITGEDF